MARMQCFWISLSLKKQFLSTIPAENLKIDDKFEIYLELYTIFQIYNRFLNFLLTKLIKINDIYKQKKKFYR